jgi:hypothetical protein
LDVTKIYQGLRGAVNLFKCYPQMPFAAEASCKQRLWTLYYQEALVDSYLIMWGVDAYLQAFMTKFLKEKIYDYLVLKLAGIAK